MKRLLTMITGVLVVASLVACSSDQTNEDTETQPVEDTQPIEETEAEESEDRENDEEQPAEEEPADTPVDQEPEIKEQTEPSASLLETKDLDVKVEGDIDKRPSKLHKSELGYAIYVLEDYEFTAEEPGKDILYSTFDDEFFIRIEPLASDVTAEERKELIKQHATGQLFENVTVDVSHLQYSMLEEITTDTEKVSVMHVGKEVDGQLFAFTLHMPLKEAVEGIGPGFLAMIESVTTKQ